MRLSLSAHALALFRGILILTENDNPANNRLGPCYSRPLQRQTVAGVHRFRRLRFFVKSASLARPDDADKGAVSGRRLNRRMLLIRSPAWGAGEFVPNCTF